MVIVTGDDLLMLPHDMSDDYCIMMAIRVDDDIKMDSGRLIHPQCEPNRCEPNRTAAFMGNHPNKQPNDGDDDRQRPRRGDEDVDDDFFNS